MAACGAWSAHPAAWALGSSVYVRPPCSYKVSCHALSTTPAAASPLILFSMYTRRITRFFLHHPFLGLLLIPHPNSPFLPSCRSPPPHTVELRSDTFTRPCDGMRKAMYAAEVGDACYNEDKTVQRLEEVVAGLLGKEAGMFAASGTMTNLLALAAHCKRGDEIVLGHQNHIYNYEGGGASALLGVAFHPVATLDNGTNRMEDLREAIRDDDFHFARTSLVAVETTHNKANGAPLPLSFMAEVAGLCREHKLIFHVDGARLMNASVALQTPAAEIVRHTDSVSLCLSKGLGAPVGSVLVGTHAVIKEAKRQRKVLGGGWRQAGVLAAAGLYALEHNIPMLERDHVNARALAVGFSQIPGIVCDPSAVASNIVYFRVLGLPAGEVVRRLKEEYNVLLGIGAYRGDRLRAVTNLMVTEQDVVRVVAAMAEIVGETNREKVDKACAIFKDTAVAV